MREAKESPPRLAASSTIWKSLDDDALVGALRRIEASKWSCPRAWEHFKNKAWQKLTKLSAAVLSTRPDYQRLLSCSAEPTSIAQMKAARPLLAVFGDTALSEKCGGAALLRLSPICAPKHGLAIAHLRSASGLWYR